MLAPFVVEGVFVGMLMVMLLHELTSASTPLFIRLVVWVSWLLSVSCVFFVPIDISVAFYNRCIISHATNDTTFDVESFCSSQFIQGDAQSMTVMWRVVYWTIFMLCWFILPTAQSYVHCGDFSFGSRVRSAIRNNMLFYTGLGVVGIVIVVVIAVSRGLSWSGLLGLCMGASSAWALFWLVLLLGYGLVEVPRALFRLADANASLRHLYLQALTAKEELDTARRSFVGTVRAIRGIEHEDLIRLHDPLRPHFDSILEQCPSQIQETGLLEPGVVTTLTGDRDEEKALKLLVDLNSRLLVQRYALVRSSRQWQRLVREATYFECVIENSRSESHRWKPPSGESASLMMSRSRWTWHVRIRPTILRVLGLLCMCISAVVIWCETVLFPEPDLSPLSHLVHSPAVNGQFISGMSFVVLGYICMCASFALFRLRIYRRYQLLPDQATDPPSMLFCSSHMCLLVAPLCYNFLHIIHEGADYTSGEIPTEVFSQIMGRMDVLPFLGTTCNLYIPLLTLLLCLLTYADVYSRIPFLSRHGFLFTFSSKANQAAREHEGKALVKQAQEKHQQQPSASAQATQTPSRPPSRTSSFRSEFAPPALPSESSVPAPRTAATEAEQFLAFLSAASVETDDDLMPQQASWGAPSSSTTQPQRGFVVSPSAEAGAHGLFMSMLRVFATTPSPSDGGSTTREEETSSLLRSGRTVS